MVDAGAGAVMTRGSAVVGLEHLGRLRAFLFAQPTAASTPDSSMSREEEHADAKEKTRHGPAI